MEDNNSTRKQRLRETLIKYSVILVIAAAYLIFVLCTNIGIPCLFYKITGWQCTGCGISRMLISLVRLDLASAFKYNSFLFLTGPLLLAYIACSEVKYVLHGSRRMGKWEIFLYFELFFAIAYGILRNIIL